MNATLSLLLPALIPSWRFFKSVEPSPRVQWSVGDEDWRELCPRPQHVSIWEMLARLFWNPRWNAALYVVTLAERLVVAPTQHAEDELFRLMAQRGLSGDALRFRVIMVTRDAQEVMYCAEPRPV